MIAALGAQGTDVVGLSLTVGVEVDFAGVSAVGHSKFGGDDLCDSEHGADRRDNLMAGRAHDEYVVTVLLMSGKKRAGLAVDVRTDDLTQAVGDNLRHEVRLPAATQGADLIPDA